MVKEFKEFALKGNIFDLAVGVIIGGAFGKIVTSFVNDVIMPVLSIILGKINLTGLKYVISEKTGETPEMALKYGMFLQSIIDFLLVAISIFIVIKIIGKFRRNQDEAPAKPAEPTKQEVLLTEIRDLLKK